MKIPAVITAYFAADQDETADALSRVFTPDAVVVDERTTRHGLDAITAWWAAAKKEYGHTTEPLEARQSGSEVVVQGRVTGRFPGSPITLTYRFLLEGQKIARLEIG